VIGAYKARDRQGTYCGIRSDTADYPVPGTVPCPTAQTTALAEVPARLAKVPDLTKERLINWDTRSATRRCGRHVVVQVQGDSVRLRGPE
jgi:hypothetical protein